MALISAQNLRVAFGGRTLMEDATLHIERGERVGLLGRNGEGKSTLLSILAGATTPDDGVVVYESGLRVALLGQQIDANENGTVDEVIRAGLRGGEHHDHPVQRLCSLLELDGDKPFQEISGGQRRRALLGRALAAEPDVLLLDEPTNHLDVESIEWLESFLMRYQGSLLFVTHDRAFLQRLATRIVELDRGRLTSWSCNYPTYLERKEELLANEDKERALFDKVLAREEEWIRQGIKARRTRNEGRVRALKKLRKERAERRERAGKVNMSIQRAERSGSKVITVEGVTFGYDDELLVGGLSTTIMRGDKIGLMGPNGCGKTTLLNLLLGKLEPDQGTVKHGVSLDVAYFDQHREQLDESETVANTIGAGNEFVVLDGDRKHVMSYLADFLFSSERAREPVRNLSGGERNRLLLARLFTQPANVLVLDEPTNDLDTETLELLEARLLDFSGTVLVVSHDRTFLDNLCSSSLVFEGLGKVKEYVGGYSDWKRTVARSAAQATEPPLNKPKKGVPASDGNRTAPDRHKKLSYKEKREWEMLPARIEAMETELRGLHDRMADPVFFQGSQDETRPVLEGSALLAQEIDEAFTRWAELDERS
ncbi:MAG: ATP-binding cassette domain-containing protein [Gemmatimonadales bacterium]|nr:ATP-binding cassette domain-containing protein [Gemmatimonadales bacterium]MBT3956945.1 ATP-binding cassette domain-containing protein [Gemmatimonadales bacterium]MBT4436778.1 ATP-binding cassette domain-containing protein [Gemmatimonadales bacterium]MBT4912064.1 ATP-binding cassette domain-containing protein [Gemmatimonadales bacterium]MBT5045927.1 ATP-binding cassette domain-containing protein [Gemmatimonadales bacterium]